MLRAINVPVEIFVIKTLSVLNLVRVWSRNVGEGHRHRFPTDAKRSPALRLHELGKSSQRPGRDAIAGKKCREKLADFRRAIARYVTSAIFADAISILGAASQNSGLNSWGSQVRVLEYAVSGSAVSRFLITVLR